MILWPSASQVRMWPQQHPWIPHRWTAPQLWVKLSHHLWSHILPPLLSRPAMQPPPSATAQNIAPYPHNLHLLHLNSNPWLHCLPLLSSSLRLLPCLTPFGHPAQTKTALCKGLLLLTPSPLPTSSSQVCCFSSQDKEIDSVLWEYALIVDLAVELCHFTQNYHKIAFLVQPSWQPWWSKLLCAESLACTTDDVIASTKENIWNCFGIWINWKKFFIANKFHVFMFYFAKQDHLCNFNTFSAFLNQKTVNVLNIPAFGWVFVLGEVMSVLKSWQEMWGDCSPWSAPWPLTAYIFVNFTLKLLNCAIFLT